ncbi:urease accessory protein UreF [Leptothoe kymatousa TAU-MAC 1615]|uniref:Urease accessory protein UreF n=2 Tax=Leptothoe TaxID=2651725 RepID=A0ABS5Y343_9CYAN|nr:urease accessory protein UreF [Leptothoe kymatousa TAU-MAC 1615]
MFADQRWSLMQLSDSFFPSGSFTLSHGLESLIQSQEIRSTQDLRDFLELILHNKIGSMDVVALRQAHRASANNDNREIQAIDALLFARTLLQPNRDSQCKSGRALLMVSRSTWNSPKLDAIHTCIQIGKMHGLHPIIFAVVGQSIGLDEDNTIFAFLHGFLTGVCGAALRLGLIGHINAQILLKEMAPQLEMITQKTIGMDLDDMWSCTPLIDIAQMTHGALPQHLFLN